MSITSMALAGLVLLAQAANDKEEDPRIAAKEKLKTFSEALKNASGETEIVNAIRDLGQMQHSSILSKLVGMLGGKGNRDVAMAVANEVAKYKGDKKAAAALFGAASAVRSDWNLMAHYLKCMGEVGAKRVIKSVTKYFYHREDAVARAAVEACGATRSKDTIDPLINLVRDLEGIQPPGNSGTIIGGGSTGGGIPGIGGSGGGAVPGTVGGGTVYVDTAAMWRRKEMLMPLANKALQDTTGQKIGDSTKWIVWWRQNGRKFKEPEE